MKDVQHILKNKTETISQKINKPTTRDQTIKKQKDALDWFFKMIKASKDDYSKGDFRLKEFPFIGGMFHYIYDPKWKEVLPYYDTFPLVIPFKLMYDGFLGLNLHYLPPIPRAKLLDILIEKFKYSNDRMTYMKITYPLLSSTVDSKLFQPCVKHYLTDHLRSKMVLVTPDLWEEVAFLPTQRFVKKNYREVWQESIKRK